MSWTRREFLTASATVALGGLAGCATSSQTAEHQQPSDTQKLGEAFRALTLDMSAWRYDEENGVYYQLGVSYCLNPATKAHHSLAIFVPAPYFTAQKNLGGSTYTCTVDEKAIVGNFTAKTAPILMPINTAQLSSQPSPTAYSYEGLAPLMEAGCVYVYPGFRGRSAAFDSTTGSQELIEGGAPWPVADLKAAIRFLRFNADILPAHADKIFMFGYGAGAGLAAMLGASGDAEAYEPYLKVLGAATHTVSGEAISDKLYGVATWNMLTALETADSAYEWSAGQYRADGPRAPLSWGALLSGHLADAYAEWVNAAGLKDEQHGELKLDQSAPYHYAEGTYTLALRDMLSQSLTYFAQHTAFPYTHTPHHLEEPLFPGDPNRIQEHIAHTQTNDQGVAQVQSTVYATWIHYLTALNAANPWIAWSVRHQKATVQSLAAFAEQMRPATLELAPYDSLQKSSFANQLFGVSEDSTLHFSTHTATVLKEHASEYTQFPDFPQDLEKSWQEDLEKANSLEQRVAERVTLMNPFTYVSETSQQFGASLPARYWRVSEGLSDPTTPLVQSFNMVHALKHHPEIDDVVYQPVWGQGHVLAEREGTALANLVEWVVACATR